MSASNIRVFVQWIEQTVFAGEDVECQITFKNITVASASKSNASAGITGPGSQVQRNASAPSPQTESPVGNSQNGRLSRVGHGHRSTVSLSAPLSSTSQRVIRSGIKTPTSTGPPGHVHRRSVSIISLGSIDNGLDEASSQKGSRDLPQRSFRGHGRAASLQIVPRRLNTNGAGPPSAPILHRTATQPSSSFHNSPLSAASDASSLAPPATKTARHSGAHTAPNTPALGIGPPSNMRSSMSLPQNYRFPSSSFKFPPTNLTTEGSPIETNLKSPQNSSRLLSPRLKAETSINNGQVPPSRILSPLSNDTPRSSGEFYSLSNNSTETLASEYNHHQALRAPSRPTHSRQLSSIAFSNQKTPETLMMGYAQISGHFTVDGSLINQASFDDVKRKGVLGGQGGGVVVVEGSKRDSGLLRGFGWGNIGDSIGGLLRSGELSSLKDMRGVAGSKTIPLLSTPQSILFVDLKLAPGESRTYKYTFKLPRGLPPSFRGKTIKVAYNLILGTQRPGGTKEQQVMSVEVPFRVLGGINQQGEPLGHDLMSPYILLRDQAKVTTVDPQKEGPTSVTRQSASRSTASPANQSTAEDFAEYVEELLTKGRQPSGFSLLSPSETRGSRQPSTAGESLSAKDAIEMAIMRSNFSTDQQQSANRFEIARSGQRIAVVMLARPAYRLGETLTMVIDFAGAEIPCYAIHASLESSEKVDSTIALRSEASIHRVTRRTYVTHSESALFARRIVFSPTIPASATPTFITSGVSLEWKIIIEFVTPRLGSKGSDTGDGGAQLLEELLSDERGVVLAAAESLDCASFEIAVPLTIYGAVVGVSEKTEQPLGLPI